MSLSPALYSETTPVADPGDPLAIARAYPELPVFYWEQPSRGVAMVAIGVAREIQATGSRRFADVSAAATALLASITCSADDRRALRVVGGFGFSDQAGPGDTWRGFPPARFVLPRWLWIREGTRATLTRVWERGAEGAAQAALARPLASASITDLTAHAIPVRSTPPSSEERARWRERVERARAAITRGELRKVVLARRRELVFERPPDAGRILVPVRADRPACFSFWVRHENQDLIGSTPELLVRRTGDRVEASALAGSAPRSADAARDRLLGAALLACPKNGREHAIVVSAVRAALEQVADRLVAPRRPDLLLLPETHHLSTPIRGRLREPRTAFELAGLLHPTPAVCGAPRDAARALIEREEPDRGWYAGAVGWMGADGDGELAVALRSALVNGCRVTIWAGAGIVEGSDADAELAETEAKMTALLGNSGAGDAGRDPQMSAAAVGTGFVEGP